MATESGRLDIIIDNMEKKLCSNATLLKEYVGRSPECISFASISQLSTEIFIKIKDMASVDGFNALKILHRL